MARKRANGAGFGFSNEKFLELLSSALGITPVGVLGRETPLDLSTLERARGSLLIRELFSKYDDGKPSKEKDLVTWERFHEAENLCRDTNLWVSKTFKYDPFWRAVAMRVKDTLGEFSWDECARFFGHGPGSTTRLPRRWAHAAYKYSGQPESTLGNATLASCAIRMNPLWTHNVCSSIEGPRQPVKIVQGNSIITVPKNYKTDRTIAKEPCMNVYIQRGIGGVIRRRLKSVGIDLDDQKRNQIGAFQGSLMGQLATIDLSMASDTVSLELVSFILPNDWWFALEQCRSPVGVLPTGDVLRYQKVSSMGNGFTFELETLLFWSICQQVCCPNLNEKDSRILVYGDDIVVPVDQAEAVLYRLWQAGFKPNLNKTFYTGPYRESCGKHFFQGCDITPFYIRRPVRKLDRLFLVHNNLQRWCERTGVDLQEVLTRLRSLAPAQWRKPRLPDGFGDGAFIGAVNELRLDSHPHGWEFWQTRALAVSQQLLADDLPDGQIIASIMQLSRVVNSPFERKFGLEEHSSGLPVKEGRYEEVILNIPRYSPA
jgi:hypothetical protein